MAKGEQHGNREAKKPNKAKAPVIAPVALKGTLAPVTVPKKKA
jgi:hypothetical protein